MPQDASDYRDVIRSEYARRRSRNAAYSLRAFARDLEIPYSRLNEVINAKRGISAAAAQKLADKLDLSRDETQLFVARVEACHGRSITSRLQAQDRVKVLSSSLDLGALRADVFEMIAHWYHYAILELPALSNFSPESSWIAERLGISKVECEAAIARLLRIGLLKKTKTGFAPTEDFTLSTSDTPSAGLKKHHEEILSKATDAIHLQTVEERDLSAITIAINRADLPRAKEIIKKFRRSFTREMDSNPKRDAVYTLAVQFFRVDHESKGKQ